MYAFDVLHLDGEALRPLPLVERKARLLSLLPDGPAALRYSDHLEGPDGPSLFRHACRMGLEGIVSKRADRAYKAGRCAHWLKLKNPAYRRRSSAPASLS